MTTALGNQYDVVPYDGAAYAQTHPDVLAVVARLRGMSPAPVESCRVLEIGCAAGYNLIPMAVSLPNSQFVGVDYSARQIEDGQSCIAELGLDNVTLHHLDILDWDGSLGQFDYIIAHGVYSWVAAPVRDALLRLCAQALTAQGVAYISYNTYPGWFMLRGLREMMFYHVQDLSDPLERASRARAFVEWLAQATDRDTPIPYSAFPSAYRDMLQTYLQGNLVALDRDASTFLHDELSDVNDPVYFHQFVTHTRAHGLSYVGDADFSSMLSTNIPAEATTKLREMVRTSVEAEQYMDFLRNRSFRRSILCRADVKLGSALNHAALESFYFSSSASAEVVVDDKTKNQVVKFISADGASLATDHPLTVVALTYLRAHWPQRFSLDELQDAAYTSLAELNPQATHWQQALDGVDIVQRGEDRLVLLSGLIRGYGSSPELINCHVQRGRFVTHVSDCPLASPWARWQAMKQNRAADLSLRRIDLTPLERFLLARLDGTKQVDDLVQAVIVGPLARGEWRIGEEGASASAAASESDPRATVERSVAAKLEWFAKLQLLIG